ncbi:Lipoprotein-releasing system ATP-binding protein LolD [Candidatus Profftia lariciata]|uniref:lipoprotein-releasing ABC transporter ATP-binding protein LolD n=1 Tax=Candidatus Profftia lariciata TaxID=1987921 RepID=UPI001D0340D0|nr:lipoprotein-releasing ABC transporter ATP-binding protein LolD [Candidatus Profftia lariciata]UDG81721.1 Lipoprotein-releasing system ATP-binding protein LolD [Candidatus Profftia lariciata]
MINCVSSDIEVLKCKNLCKTYPEGLVYTNVFHNITFDIKLNEMIAITGHSGSGKSTLLHLLGGLDIPTSGDIFFKGKLLNNMSETDKAKLRNRELGFIYQFHHLLLDFSALENVMMPLLIGGRSSNYSKIKAINMLHDVGLSNRKNHRPSQLSGGERQRVAIARALVHDPSLVLADEPTGNLDTYNASKILELISKLNKSHGTAFLLVTHDISLANSLDCQFEMCNGHLNKI